MIPLYGEQTCGFTDYYFEDGEIYTVSLHQKGKIKYYHRVDGNLVPAGPVDENGCIGDYDLSRSYSGKVRIIKTDLGYYDKSRVRD